MNLCKVIPLCHQVIKKMVVFITAWFIFSTSDAQDIHFSMYNLCPLFLNPANTGNFKGNWRITANYREQWRALDIPFSTATAGFDKHFYFSNLKIDGGLLFMNDKTRMLSNKLFLTTALTKTIFNHNIRAGLQVGYVFKSLHSDELTMPSQWDMQTGEFNSLFSNNETNLNEKISYLDVNFGLSWKKSINIFEPEIGIALMHLTTPNESFFSQKTILPVRYIIHSRIKTKINDKYSIAPTILYMKHYRAAEMIIGSEIEYNLFGNWTMLKNIYGGLNIRSRYLNQFDAFTVMVGASIGNMKIAVNYDINISNLAVVTNGRGAFEVSLIYESLSSVLSSYSIPCERY